MTAINARLADCGFRAPALDEPWAEDLGKGRCVLLAVKSAFPLPGTGSFADLLSAIDDAEQRGAAWVSPVEAGTQASGEEIRPVDQPAVGS